MNQKRGEEVLIAVLDPVGQKVWVCRRLVGFRRCDVSVGLQAVAFHWRQ